MKIKNKGCLISLMLFIFITIFVFVAIYIILSPANDYSKNVYSVVLHNTTNEIIDGITVSYGRDYKEADTLYIESRINDLKPNEYRKVNINTSSPSVDAKIPYNVWVTLKHDNGVINRSAGYFAVDIGGLAYFDILKKENELELKRINSHKIKYIFMDIRNRKKQGELSWYK